MNTQTDEHKMLQDHVDRIANDLTNGIELDADEHAHLIEDNDQEPGDMMYASDYLSDVLDIQYIVTGSGDYLGARILVAFGGPNIWINTQSGVVEGYWWGDSAFSSFTDNIGLDDFLEEMWSCR